MVQAPSRRDRVRAATAQEIKDTARRLLVQQGQDAATLRAIAGEMGMTAPALYRYFGSREELIKHVIADIFSELADDLQAAINAAGAAAAGAGQIPELTAKMVAACQQFRRWALGHKEEYSLLFGTPLPGVDERDEIIDECGRKFGGTFFTLFLELWQRNPFPVPAREEIDPGLREQLELYRDRLWHRAVRGRAAGRRDGHLPALLDEALRSGDAGGVRPPEVRARRCRAHVRLHALRDGHPARPGVPAAARRQRPLHDRWKIAVTG